MGEYEYRIFSYSEDDKPKTLKCFPELNLKDK